MLRVRWALCATRDFANACTCYVRCRWRTSSQIRGRKLIRRTSSLARADGRRLVWYNGLFARGADNEAINGHAVQAVVVVIFIYNRRSRFDCGVSVVCSRSLCSWCARASCPLSACVPRAMDFEKKVLRQRRVASASSTWLTRRLQYAVQLGKTKGQSSLLCRPGASVVKNVARAHRVVSEGLPVCARMSCRARRADLCV